ncbi:MAG: GNAT family N-acetyltransferase [Symbiobacterium sp.]|uniref:GNAT family N-acetyltransferase n=1 Tax=Symbiobacterium sp. TaxID=1971213 RepID=UPI003463CED0
MYQIRPGHAGDLAWLQPAAAAAFWESLSPEERTRVSPGLAAQRAALQCRQVLATPGSALLVAQQGLAPVGYLLLAVAPDGSTEEPTVLIIDLWVHPAHRRRGVASALLAAAERGAAGLGLRKIKLWTGLHHLPAMEFALRRGFVPAGLIGVKDL